MARVLLVDDEEGIRRTIVMFLEAAGHEVETAGNAAEASERVADREFDVILSDIVLPGADGIRLLEFVRARSPHTQFVLITGEPTVATATEALRLGAFDYLPKPLLKETVCRVVERAASEKEMRGQSERLRDEVRRHGEVLERLVEERTAELKGAMDRLEARYREQAALDQILRHSLAETSLGDMLAAILDDLFSIPWLELQKKGAILIVDEQTGNLRMAANSGMASDCVRMCGTVARGWCLCGRVLETGKVMFSEDLDDRHDTRYEGMSPHGHYCVPLTANGVVVGVLTTYLPAGHVRRGGEERFLLAAADVIAGLIARDRNEKRFRAVFDGSNDAVMMLTQEGFFDCNPRTLEMFGFDSRDEFLRVHPVDISPPVQPDGRTSLAAAGECIRIALEKGSHSFEWAHRRQGGGEFIADVMLSTVDFGGRRVLQATVRDITDRKQAEALHKQTLSGIIQAIALTVEVRDPYTAGHQRRVSAIAKAIAAEMGFSPDAIEGVGIAGLVHDLGKIAVPTEILSKPSRLSAAEMEIVKTHVTTSFEILKGIQFPWPIAEMAYQHHERTDGSGYPRGLKGDQILPGARILCVADVVEAMSSHRPYRAALGITIALEEIEARRGSFYDVDVSDTCLRLFRVKGFQVPP